MTEDGLQQMCYMWFHNTYKDYRGLLFSVPNGGERDAITAKIMKATGLVPGVADMCMVWKGRAYFIEMKLEKGVQSKKQKDWENKITQVGKAEYKIIRSKEQFIKHIQWILNQ